MIGQLFDQCSWFSTIWWYAVLFAWVTQSRPALSLHRFMVWVHQKLWILVPVGLLSIAWQIPDQPDLLTRVFATLSISIVAYTWWAFRNWPDENKWTKRGKRLAAKVAALRGKLVVVPATA